LFSTNAEPLETNKVAGFNGVGNPAPPDDKIPT
jgi:hypothetical protein